MSKASWLAVAFALALVFATVRCSKEVNLGVDPGSDAAAADAGDAGAGAD